jgi:hypothetical protein
LMDDGTEAQPDSSSTNATWARGGRSPDVRGTSPPRA